MFSIKLITTSAATG